MTRRTDVVVIGGGQSGLAAGYHLRRLGLDFVILDAGPSPGGAWLRAWDSLRLFSPAAYSSLPGRLMPPQPGETYPGAAHVVAYLSAYEERYDLPVHRPVRVSGVHHDGALLRVETDAGTWLARAVISATGTWSRPFVPAVPGRDEFGGTQLHTVGYENAAAFAGKRVMVVGGGNSGAQIAADLATAGSGPAGRPWLDGIDADGRPADLATADCGSAGRRSLHPADADRRPAKFATADSGSAGRPWFHSVDADGRPADIATADSESDGRQSTHPVDADRSSAALAYGVELTWVTLREPRYLPDDIDGRALFDHATARRRALDEGRADTGGVASLGDIVAVPPVRAARDAGLLKARPMFARLTRTGVEWADGTRADADVIIWCTGFRPALAHLAPLGLRDRRGHIATTGTQALGEPRVHLLGYGDWTGPASATLIGVGRPAREAARSIARLLD
ncbi:FAD-dependent oxidoreductase [Streptomyces sp. CB02261]|uniref:FAD-dependent oxidoreductase n=1 Tax=Streptomyces sp. CB02261 TaxID=1703940 RepID=UPI0009609E90|nr:FAD-dependent oxidoreductase [Streptomyces sp. CB02261]OKJ69598.1 pyridine nucleotide-disulfide oxidoreductase [Streptomyces sp. CB02261]